MKKKYIFVILLTIMAIFCCTRMGMFKAATIEGVKNCITSFGIFAPIAYIVMFSLVPLTLFPDAVLAIAGGVIFGVYWGTFYTIVGAACGGTLSFFISRILGRNVVEKLIKHKAKWFEDGAEKKGFLIILIMRLVPLIPFDIISYGAGLSKIRYKDFILATIIGIIPGVFVYTNLGDKAVNIWSVEFLTALAILAALCVVSFILKKRVSRSKLIDNVLED